MRVQPPPEKCEENAYANDPKPQRETWPASDEPEEELDEDEPGEESPLKKLVRDDELPPELLCPLPEDDEPRGAQSLGCPGDAAMPGRFG
jgi:hypothetical protein